MTRKPGSAPTCEHCAIRDACTLNRLGAQEQTLLPARVRERIFLRGDVLQQEGDTAAFVRVVKLGTALGYRRGVDGHSRPIGIVRLGGALGVFATFGMPNQATCVALTRLRVCEIPVAALRRACACGSKLAEEVARSVVATFASVTAWSEAMRLPGVVNQLAYVLVLLVDSNHAAVIELPKQSALAELLGTRRETVARALRLLEQEGGVRRHARGRYEVFRPQLLARLPTGVR